MYLLLKLSGQMVWAESEYFTTDVTFLKLSKWGQQLAMFPQDRQISGSPFQLDKNGINDNSAASFNCPSITERAVEFEVSLNT